MSYTRFGQVSAEIRSLDEALMIALYRPSISAAYAKTGDYSMYFATRGAAGVGFAQNQSIRAGCHYLIPSFGATGYYPLYFTARGSTSPAHGLRADADNETLDLIVDGVEVDSVSFAEAGIIEEQWFHVAMTFDNAGGNLYAWGENFQIFHYVGSFTASSINGAWSGHPLSVFGGISYMDNLYADQMTDEPYAERPPRKHFFFKKPNAPGTYYDWTTVGESANWRAVDDTPHNSDTDYNKALAEDLLDTFETTSVSIPENDDDWTWIIRAVIPEVIIKRNEDSLDADVRVLTHDGVSFEYGDDHVNVGPGYQQFWHRFEQQPDGSSWNETDINLMEYGYQSQGTFA